MTTKQLEQSQTTQQPSQQSTYSEQFQKAFRKLVKALSVEDLAKYMKISEQEVRRIKRTIGIS